MFIHRLEFYAPWQPYAKWPVEVIIRHLVRCNAVEVTHTTPPADVAPQVAALGDEQRAAIDTTVQTFIDGLPEIFGFVPPLYRDLDRGIDPYAEICSGNDRFSQIFVAGGRMGGKSWGVMAAAIERASVEKRRIALIREAAIRLKDGALHLAKVSIAASRYAADWDVGEHFIRNTRTGSTCVSVGVNEATAHGAASAARGLEGVDIGIVEEASFLHEISLTNIIPTILRTPGAMMVFCLNPGEVPSPAEELFVDGVPDRAMVAYRSCDRNPFLFLGPGGQEVLNAWRRLKTSKFRHVYRGDGLERSELAVFEDGVSVGYLNWDQFDHDALSRITTRFGMDFSLSVGSVNADPNAAVKVHLIPADVRPDYAGPGSVKPILYVEREAVANDVGTDQLYTLPEQIGARGGDTIWCDSQSILIDAMNQKGAFNATAAEKGPGSIMAGLSKIASCDILCSPRAPIAAEEFRALKWETDRRGKVKRPLRPEPGGDHCIDAARYSLSGLQIGSPSDGVYHL